MVASSRLPKFLSQLSTAQVHIRTFVKRTPNLRIRVFSVYRHSAYLGNQRGGALAHKRELNAYFPTDGAKKIAQSILDLLGDAPPISGKFRWTSFDRDGHQRAKFTATLADVTQGAPGSVTSLYDSVFLMSP